MKTELIEYHRQEVLIYKNVFGQARAGSRPCAEAAVLKDFHERAVAWLESLAEDTPTLNIVHTPEGLTFIKPPA